MNSETKQNKTKQILDTGAEQRQRANYLIQM